MSVNLIVGWAVTLATLVAAAPAIFRVFRVAATANEEWRSTKKCVRRGAMIAMCSFYLVGVLVFVLFSLQWTLGALGRPICVALTLSLWFMYFVVAKSLLYITFFYRCYDVFKDTQYRITRKFFNGCCIGIVVVNIAFVTTLTILLADGIQDDCLLVASEERMMLLMALNLTYCFVDFCVAVCVAMSFVYRLRQVVLSTLRRSVVSTQLQESQTRMVHLMYKLTWLSIMAMVSSWGFGIVIVNESWYGAAVDVVVTIYVILCSLRVGSDYYDVLCLCCVNRFQLFLKKCFKVSLEQRQSFEKFEPTSPRSHSGNASSRSPKGAFPMSVLNSTSAGSTSGPSDSGCDDTENV